MTLKQSWPIHNSIFYDDCQCATHAKVELYWDLNLLSLWHKKKLNKMKRNEYGSAIFL